MAVRGRFGRIVVCPLTVDLAVYMGGVTTPERFQRVVVDQASFLYRRRAQPSGRYIVPPPWKAETVCLYAVRTCGRGGNTASGTVRPWRMICFPCPKARKRQHAGGLPPAGFALLLKAARVHGILDGRNLCLPAR